MHSSSPSWQIGRVDDVVDDVDCHLEHRDISPCNSGASNGHAAPSHSEGHVVSCQVLHCQSVRYVSRLGLARDDMVEEDGLHSLCVRSRWQTIEEALNSLVGGGEESQIGVPAESSNQVSILKKGGESGEAESLKALLQGAKLKWVDDIIEGVDCQLEERDVGLGNSGTPNGDTSRVGPRLRVDPDGHVVAVQVLCHLAIRDVLCPHLAGNDVVEEHLLNSRSIWGIRQAVNERLEGSVGGGKECQLPIATECLDETSALNEGEERVEAEVPETVLEDRAFLFMQIKTICQSDNADSLHFQIICISR